MSRDMLFGYVCCFNDTATTEIYTLSLHDALPISQAAMRILEECVDDMMASLQRLRESTDPGTLARAVDMRSEEHTSELQSRQYLVCRLLLEKKTNITRAIRSDKIWQTGVIPEPST